MNYISTRGAIKHACAAKAIADGIAPDGGLYTPEAVVPLTPGFLKNLAGMSYADRAAAVLGLYLTDFTPDELKACAHAAYDGKFGRPDGFDETGLAPVDGVSVTALGNGENVLELFWGPTCAFKDMALQMLPHLLTASLRKLGESRTVCILVATSGDTGKAALEGFRDVPGTKIAVFYPDEGVSDVQKLQMVTQAGKNVGVCAVRGNFDDAQTGVKKIFTDPAMRDSLQAQNAFFSSANSINWGRLAPQIAYYVSGYLDMVKAGSVRFGEKINICVPTGNFGNILAAWFAKHMGLPVGKLICASNANDVLTDFIRTGVYDRRRPFRKTLSPSMDILISSNVERLLYYLSGDTAYVTEKLSELNTSGRYEVTGSALDTLREDFASYTFDDDATKAMIRRVFDEKHYLLDPHSAVAFCAHRAYREETGDRTPVLTAATASAFKFCAGVCEALSGNRPSDDFAAIDTLSALAGQPAPAPLSALRGREVRFPEKTDREAMPEAVLRMLSRAEA